MYTKQIWTAREGADLNRFTKSEETSASVKLVNNPGTLTVAGTPFTVDRMNHMEQGIYDAANNSQSITGDAFVDSSTKVFFVNTNNNINIYVPISMPIGHYFTVNRIATGLTTNGVDVEFLGGDTIYGAASITIFGAATAKTGKYIESFTFQKITATTWEIVAGCDSGKNTYGSFSINYDGTLRQWGNTTGESVVFSAAGSVYTGRFASKSFPQPFISTDYVVTARIVSNSGGFWISEDASSQYTTSAFRFYAYVFNNAGTITLALSWEAIGKWR